MGSRVTTAVAFINSEGSDLHDGIGGASHFDPAVMKFVKFEPYKQLAEALKIYIPQKLTTEIEGDDTSTSWDRLSEKICQTECGYSDTLNGFWRKIWYNIGETEDICHAWVALIPDEYGLAVVKTGLAVVFQLAGKSLAKREKIFDTFKGLRDALVRASPDERSFRDHRKVSDCADELYQAVVNSIEDMILVTSKDKTSSWRNPTTKFKRKPASPDPTDILQKVTDASDKFERALGNARDQAIESAGRIGQYNAVLATNIHHDVTRYGERLETIGGEVHEQYAHVNTNMNLFAVEARSVKKGVEENGAFLRQESEKNDIWRASIESKILSSLSKTRMIAARENAIQDDQVNSKNGLVELLVGHLKKQEAEVASLRQKVDRIQKRGRVIMDLNRFGQILAQYNSSSREPVELDQLFQHPNNDFDLALMQRSRFSTEMQGQVQSLLENTRFLQWISCEESDTILVDANIPSSDLGLSAISVFSATLVAGLVKVHENDVVAHFFCSNHTNPRETWYGPGGMIRSIIVQVLMRLVEMRILDLDFIDNEDFVRALNKHDLPSLCEVLYSLVSQFPPTITVYCILDSISAFDNTSAFKNLKIALDWIQSMCEDRSLNPIFKVLMTNPTSSTGRMKQLLKLREYPSRLVNLSMSSFIPMELSNLSVESQLLRPSTPTPSMGSRAVSRNRTRSRSVNRRGYEDEY